MCGGTIWHVLHNRVFPRVRAGRSIPACAGEPPCSRSSYLCPERSIPACAGEPMPHHACAQACPWVYPRVCGGTGRASGQSGCGLSPRVRGNRDGDSNDSVMDGSIPACAGEPWLALSGVRGSRSIPACAGEPDLFGNQLFLCSQVYPRVCGGTDPYERLVRSPGVYPRVCGGTCNAKAPDSVTVTRSIPACAGEPTCLPAPRAPGRVYPRVCGGTLRSTLRFTVLPGLSPRVRGNPWLHPDGHMALCGGTT